MRKRLTVNKKNKKNNNIVIAPIIMAVVFGILAGSFLANNLTGDNQIRLTSYLNKFFENYNSLSLESSDVFKESFVKYGKIILIIWLSAFVPFGFVFGGSVVFFKAVSYGFTTAFLVISYGAKGVYYACFLYLLQNIVLIPAYVFISFAGVRFAFLKNRPDNDTLDSFFEYAMSLVISLACLILACFLEAYVIPNFIAGA